MLCQVEGRAVRGWLLGRTSSSLKHPPSTPTWLRSCFYMEGTSSSSHLTGARWLPQTQERHPRLPETYRVPSDKPDHRDLVPLKHKYIYLLSDSEKRELRGVRPHIHQYSGLEPAAWHSFLMPHGWQALGWPLARWPDRGWACSPGDSGAQLHREEEKAR